MTRIVSILIVFIFISHLLFVNCGKRSFTFPEPSLELNEGALTIVTEKMIYANTEYSVDLGTLTVRENRNGNNSRFIHLPLIRVRTNAEKPLEPVFRLTGGPGMSNMEHVGMLWYLMPHHDIILLGYRGVDGSSILSCPELKKAVKGRGDIFSEKSLRAISKAWQESAQRLREEGVDIDCYTIIDVIKDLETARQAFGYEKINLKSASYGTRVAYLYGLIHPERIHRSAMISINPPGRFVWERDVLDEQLRDYSKLWANDPDASARSNDLYSDMMNVLKRMPDHWLFLPIDEGKVRSVAFCLLFDNAAMPLVFDAFIAARDGDYSGLALMSLAYDFVLPEMFTWGELACKAVSADYDSIRDYIADMAPTEQYPMGSPMSQLLWSPMNYGGWPVKSIPKQYRTLQDSDVETLLLSGSIDVGTPTRYAVQDLLPHLKNGRHFILAERGHMNIQWPNPEACQRLISSFYETGVADQSLNKTIPMNFTVAHGFPFMAKLGLGIIALIIAIIIGTSYLVIRRVQKKHNTHRHNQIME
ncbi:alpha/beta fold hydrolase [candidate division KSB1 bacterium]|nr:alpha/beta fold hydrolase [candidate division KSB1 bacterium]